MLEYAKDNFGEDTLWTFQQDGTTSHITNVSQNWFRDHIPNFGPKKCGLHAPRILIPWIFRCGLSLKARPVKNSSHC